jgi:hypothetical protein
MRAMNTQPHRDAAQARMDAEPGPAPRKKPTRHLSAIEMAAVYTRVCAEILDPRCEVDPEAIQFSAAIARAAVNEFARLNGLDPMPGE